MTKNLNIIKDYNYSIFILTILLLLNFLSFSIEIKSILFILFLLVAIFIIPEVKVINLRNIPVALVILFIFLIFTQNQYLEYETISIDIPSYLVASQNVGINELPFETQWESKGPVFMYLYNLISYFSGENLVLFKLINDLILFVIILFFFFTLLINNEDSNYSFIGALLFSSILSYVWYHSEFSEIYCLIFISFHFYFVQKYELSPKNIFISSVALSLSTLINQATVVFYFAFFLLIIKNKKSFMNLKEFMSLFFGGLIPHLIFILFYFRENLISIYFSNYITLPLNYTGSDSFKFGELFIWLKRYFEFNEVLYLTLLSIFVFFIVRKLNGFVVLFKNNEIFDIFIYLMVSFSIYVIAGHSYEHHLFYSIYFLSILSVKFLTHRQFGIFTLLVLVSSIQIFAGSFVNSYKNLTNLDEVYESYPLYNLSKEIDSYFEDKPYSVLAFDHVLVLHYLQKPNISYIIHPFNNYENYILNELTNLGKLKTNEASHFSYYIELEPDVIICNSMAIIDGDPVNLDTYNCEITDYKNNYFKLDTKSYEDNKSREFFFDPYKEVSVYIKSP